MCRVSIPMKGATFHFRLDLLTKSKKTPSFSLPRCTPIVEGGSRRPKDGLAVLRSLTVAAPCKRPKREMTARRVNLKHRRTDSILWAGL